MEGVAPVVVPPNEEGTRATVLRWCKQVGQAVVKDEPLVELETDKVTVEVSAPADGTLLEILKQENEEVQPDDLLARIGLAGNAARNAQAAPAGAAMEADADARLSPAVRKLLRERELKPEEIRGTGRDGRITAQDVENHEGRSTRRAAPQPLEAAHDVANVAHEPAAVAPGRVSHTAIRRRVAEHMVRSLAEAPHVTTLFEADLARVLAHRARHVDSYAARGARLTLTAYFVHCCARALMRHREVNATFHADALELHADANIGIGTALGDKGLIVPVIHGAQRLDLFETARRLGERVEAARAGKLAPQDVRGGTFTISNHGVGGSLLAAPIVISQPQVAILGIGKVQRRVCVIEAEGAEAIAVRSMCYLTLSLDHRALDGFQANAFLSSVVATLEEWPEEA